MEPSQTRHQTHSEYKFEYCSIFARNVSICSSICQYMFKDNIELTQVGLEVGGVMSPGHIAAVQINVMHSVLPPPRLEHTPACTTTL
jgi:hypothetical protein